MWIVQTGIRNLRDILSRCIRRIEAGERTALEQAAVRGLRRLERRCFTRALGYSVE
jgi:hypothetical protein